MLWASFLISAVLLTAVLLLVDPTALTAAAAGARWEDTLSAVGIYLLMIAVRGFRLSFLLTAATGRTYPLLSGLHLASLSVFGNHVLPAKSGDAAIAIVPWLAQGARLEEGLATLLLSRIHDVLAILCLASLSLMIMAPWGAASLAAGGALIACLFGCIRSHQAAAILGRALGVVLIASRRLFGLRARAEAFVERLADCGKAIQGGALGTSLALSLLLWLLHTAFIALLLKSMGIDLPYAEIFLGSLGATVAQLLPLSVMGNLGTYELGWVAGFTATGMSPAQAASTAILTHGLAILVSTAAAAASLSISGPGLVTTYRRWRRNASIP